ncbi:MAG: hypothetical protein NVSMB25_13210 [Thermoleophilaceae bacterium]
MKASLGFPSRAKAFAAGLISLLAVSALFVYVSAPVSAKPTLAVKYVVVSAKNGNVVRGVVKSSSGPVRRALITVRVRNSSGRVIARVHVRTDKLGRFAVKLPGRANHVRVVFTVTANGRSTTRVLQARPGQAIDVTAVFPPRNSGLLPGVFPY